MKHPAPILPPIATKMREVARLLKAEANKCDEAFLKTADSRAIQGGAICEEANEWRELSNKAYVLAVQITQQEE